MEGLVIMGLCFMLLALVWVVYLAPKAARERQQEFIRRLRESGELPDAEPTDESEEEAGQDE
jgi:hypothetical protein